MTRLVYIFNPLFFPNNHYNKTLKNALNLHERETLRKRVNILIPQIKKSEIVEHFAKRGIVNSTFYDAIKFIATGEPIKDKKCSGLPKEDKAEEID